MTDEQERLRRGRRRTRDVPDAEKAVKILWIDGYGHSDDPWNVMRDAKDEIDRLRAINARLLACEDAIREIDRGEEIGYVRAGLGEAVAGVKKETR